LLSDFSLSKNLHIFENGVWGVAPSGVRAAAPHSAPAWMPGVYAQRLCTMQSQQSIHSPSPRGRGLGFRQGCRDRTPKGSMQGRIQVVEQSRCRTHRQQTTTIAETQSPQSVLKGIENSHYLIKTDFFYKLESDSATCCRIFFCSVYLKS
jgi:hypothetical protein